MLHSVWHLTNIKTNSINSQREKEMKHWKRKRRKKKKNEARQEISQRTMTGCCDAERILRNTHSQRRRWVLMCVCVFGTCLLHASKKALISKYRSFMIFRSDSGCSIFALWHFICCVHQPERLMKQKAYEWDPGSFLKSVSSFNFDKCELKTSLYSLYFRFMSFNSISLH